MINDNTVLLIVGFSLLCYTSVIQLLPVTLVQGIYSISVISDWLLTGLSNFSAKFIVSIQKLKYTINCDHR